MKNLPHPAWTFLLLILLLLLFAIFLAFAAMYYYEKGGINAYLGFAALLISIATLTATTIIISLTLKSLDLTKKSLELTSTDITARVRPFISVYKVDVEAPISGTSKVFLALTDCTLHIQNTGPVPAKNLEVHVSLIATQDSRVAKELHQSLASLAPNVPYPLDFTGILSDSDIQLNIIKGATKLRVHIKYEGIDEGIGKFYDTDQLFRIEKDRVQMQGYPVIFKPDQPSTFS